MSKELKKNIIGTKKFGPVIDVTDPCYERNVWCRINDVVINPGNYECIAWTNDDCRVAILGIYFDGKIIDRQEMEFIDEIGVDSGLAGFFENKPNYSQEEWESFCGKIKKGNYWIIDCGVFSYSGYGDGMYEVYAHKTNGVIDAIEIRF